MATREELRGRGLARLVCRAFVRECLQKGIAPSWDCFEQNEPSYQLALDLGFREQRRYPFYTINT